MRRYVGVLLLLSAWAVAAEPATLAPGPSISGQLGSLVMGLALVIGLIFVLAWLAKRVQRITPHSGQTIQLLASQALGPKERLLLVQVGEEQVLLGLTAGRITPLHVLQKPVEVDSPQASTPEFAQRLLEVLGKAPKGQA